MNEFEKSEIFRFLGKQTTYELKKPILVLDFEARVTQDVIKSVVIEISDFEFTEFIEMSGDILNFDAIVENIQFPFPNEAFDNISRREIFGRELNKE